MEFRYVFRRVEDAIGAPLTIQESPHAYLTRKLRRDLRESRDIARHTEVTALCLASLAGNPSMDARGLADRVSELLSDVFKELMPYSKEALEAHDTPQETNYDEYFKELEEMKKEIAAKKAAEQTDAAT